MTHRIRAGMRPSMKASSALPTSLANALPILAKHVHTNTVGRLLLLPRHGLVGTCHNVREQHPQRHIEEFDFRYNTIASPLA